MKFISSCLFAISTLAYGATQVIAQDTIYDVAVANNLTVATLIDAAGLAPTLSDPNSTFTVLAPVNEAFLIPDRVVTYLLDNIDILTFVLLGHVVGGIAATEEIVRSLDGQDVTFLNNATQTIDASTNATLVGVATVVVPDVPASNGVVHLINRVLGLPTALESIQSNPDGAGLNLALQAAQLAGTLEATPALTLFTPPTAAFFTLPGFYPQLAAEIIDANPSFVLHVRDLTLMHMIGGSVVFSEDIPSGDTVVTMANGENITISATTDGVTVSPAIGITGIANVVAFDSINTQGVFHVVDAILAPSFLLKTVVAVALEETSTVASLVVAAGLVDALESAFDITLFAPNNAAFDKLPAATLEFLGSPEGAADLDLILKSHVATVTVPSVGIPAGETTLTTLGLPIVVEASETGVVLNGMSSVVGTDFLANNGIVHIIDTVLVPEADDEETTEPTASPVASPVDSPASPTASPVAAPEEPSDSGASNLSLIVAAVAGFLALCLS